MSVRFTQSRAMEMDGWIRKSKSLILAALMALSFAGFLAASADTATITIGSTGNSRYNTTTGGTQAVIAGSVYNLNLNAQSSTNYWAGAFGNVSGAVQLRNTAGKDLFTLNLATGVPQQSTANNIYSMVMAYNNAAVPLFNSLNALRTGANIDTVTGVPTTLTDSGTNTFTANPVISFIVGNQTLAFSANTAFFANSYNASTGGSSSGAKITSDSTYWTACINDSTNNLLFASPAVPIVWPGVNNTARKLFDNTTTGNYEMLLYANDSGTSATTTYSFYLELR